MTSDSEPKHPAPAPPTAADVFIAALSANFHPDERERTRKAVEVVLKAPEETIVRPRGIDVAARLQRLNVDAPTLQAALLSDPRLRESLDPSFVERHFGTTVANLVRNVNWLNTFNEYSQDVISQPEQAEDLRRMLLAMVTDVRAVLIKLAYRLQRLRILPQQDYDVRLYIARETMDIYAPLANRLGIGQLKWELEDLAFRYIHPQEYKTLATALAENRRERERYIESFTEALRDTLGREGIEAEIYGRPKHIYSIWRKMVRKKVPFEELYDLRAVRIIVDKVSTCYAVLGTAHSLWQYVPKEFDDYIANPKENGYQSLHTVVVGPRGLAVEIQIRTREMHEFAEYGVAAHWNYKEGGKQDVALQKNIASLRRLLENRNPDEDLLDNFRSELYADHIFVLSAKGEVKSLPVGATALDYAYALAPDTGHRCRGAKVNGRIVPLTLKLKSGDRIELLHVKHGGPNRNWMNPNLGYLKTPHAVNAVKAWFKHQAHELHLTEGRAALEKECRRLNIAKPDLNELARRLGLPSGEDVLIAIGSAEIGPARLADALSIPRPKRSAHPPQPEGDKPAAPDRDSITIQGVGNVLTTFAKCCTPQSGDPVVGYLTVGKGISIHRRDCRNLLRLPPSMQVRLIDVSWGKEAEAFLAGIHIEAFDRRGLLRDITQTLSNAKVNILDAHTHTNPEDLSVTMDLTVEIRNTRQLRQVLDRIEQLPNVLEARRVEASAGNGFHGSPGTAP